MSLEAKLRFRRLQKSWGILEIEGEKRKGE